MIQQLSEIIVAAGPAGPSPGTIQERENHLGGSGRELVAHFFGRRSVHVRMQAHPQSDFIAYPVSQKACHLVRGDEEVPEVGFRPLEQLEAQFGLKQFSPVPAQAADSAA